MGKAYNHLKIFHHTQKLNSLLSEVTYAPVHIRIKPTNLCNHKCWYCAFRLKGEQIGKDMVGTDSLPYEKMLQIVEDLKYMCVEAVTFSGGGEPLCYKYIYEFIDRLDTKVAVLTNGALLTGEIAKLLARKASWVRVSIDGWDNESYSEYRGVDKDEFFRVISNMANYKGKYLGVAIVVDKKNYTHLYDMIKLFYELGAKSVKVAPVIMSGDISKMNTYHRDLKEVVNAQIVRAKKHFEADFFEINDSYHSQMESFKKDYNWCPYGQITPIIGADCNVYYCHDKAYNLDKGIMGSIKDISFQEFWYNGKEKFFTIDPSKDCNHHCMCDKANKNIIEYLNAKKEHREFI